MLIRAIRGLPKQELQSGGLPAAQEAFLCYAYRFRPKSAAVFPRTNPTRRVTRAGKLVDPSIRGLYSARPVHLSCLIRSFPKETPLRISAAAICGSPALSFAFFVPFA